MEISKKSPAVVNNRCKIQQQLTAAGDSGS